MAAFACADTVPGTPLLAQAWDLHPLTRRRIDYRAERLARVFGLSDEDREDLAQDLALEVVGALRRHDPSISSATHFARRVMDQWYRYNARKLRLQRERQPQTVPLPQRDAKEHLDRRLQRDDTDQIALKLDLEAAIRSLPPDLAEVAEQLKTHSVAEIARARGCHRGTVYRLVQRIRKYLAPLKEAHLNGVI